MSHYDPYDAEPPRRHKHRSRRDRDDYGDEPRYVETRETYVRGSPTALAAPDPPIYASRTTELARRPIQREESDYSIEEVRRDFPPPGARPAYVQESRSITRNDRYGQAGRARSADHRTYDYNDQAYGAYRDDPRRSDDRQDRRGRDVAIVREAVVKPRKRSLSRNQKILAGVAGAALAVGGKELFDRRGDIKHAPENRNLLGTAVVGAAGAFAGYEGAEFVAKRVNTGEEKVKERKYVAVKDSRGDVADYYTSDEEIVKRPKQSRRKSIVDSALALAGIGAAKSAVDKRDRRDRDRDYSSDDRKSTRSRRSRRGSSGEGDGLARVQQAAKAALLAGATEAFRVRNEPGGWAGAKGKRILTAAIGASAIDAAADRNPDQNSKRHILEAVIGGLAGNRLINGTRNDIAEDRDGRSVHDRSGSRTRSRSRGGGGGGGGGGAGGPLAALAAAGLAGLGVKKIADRDRSRSRSRGDRRRYSSDEDDRGPRNGKRSKSMSDRLRSGLASVGIGGAAGAAAGAANADRHDRDRGSRSRDARDDEYSSRGGGGRRRRDRGSDDDYDDPRRSSRDLALPVASGALGAYEGGRRDRRRGGNDGGDYDDNRSQRSGKSRRNKDGVRDRRQAEGKERNMGSGSSSDLGSSSGDEKQAKKMKGKQLITAGLATVATIHAAHNVYQSMEKRDARHKAVEEGEMTPDEAHKLKMKARLQDAASIGIAALGIKGAYSEWKEMKEMRDECREFEEKKVERHQKRMERQKALREGDKKGSKRPPNRRLESASNPELRYGGYEDGEGYDNYTASRPSGPPRYIDDNPYSTSTTQPAYGYDGRR